MLHVLILWQLSLTVFFLSSKVFVVCMAIFRQVSKINLIRIQ